MNSLSMKKFIQIMSMSLLFTIPLKSQSTYQDHLTLRWKNKIIIIDIYEKNNVDKIFSNFENFDDFYSCVDLSFDNGSLNPIDTYEILSRIILIDKFSYPRTLFAHDSEWTREYHWESIYSSLERIFSTIEKPEYFEKIQQIFLSKKLITIKNNDVIKFHKMLKKTKDINEIFSVLLTIRDDLKDDPVSRKFFNINEKTIKNLRKTCPLEILSNETNAQQH